MKVSASIEIEKPPSAVYKFLTDDENLRLWVSNFIRFEREMGEKGQTQYRIYNVNGQVIKMQEVVLKTVEDRMYHGRLLGKKLDLEITNLLTPLDHGCTLLEADAEYTLKSFWLRFSYVWNRKNIEKRLQSDLARLKEAVEKLNDEPFST